jgi:hypothetical protein
VAPPKVIDPCCRRRARRIARIQADLNTKRLGLLELRGELDAARTRLAQLEAREAHAERVLARQLVAGCESDPPDIVTSSSKTMVPGPARAARVRAADPPGERPGHH